MKGEFLAVEFGKALHMARWGRGISLAEAGRLTGVTATTIGTYENAASMPLLPVYFAVCDEFGLNPSDYIVLQEIEKGG